MSEFASLLVNWQRRDGRHDLPWQRTRDPYRIWLSEIMLQQTQVSAVIPYYERFLAEHPTIESLAAAGSESVMQLWAGLGYYARARNLHRAAQMVVHEHGGTFPREFAQVLALPGVGRSTAAAICAFAYGDLRPILDGNVKRVFARYFAIEGDVRATAREPELWSLAESLLPSGDIETYIQAQMDLGATVCKRSNPSCLLCPLQESCRAHQQGRVDELPHAREAKVRPRRATQMLVLLHGDTVLLERRPPTGIWGGLLSLPEIPTGDDPSASARDKFGVSMTRGRRPEPLPSIEHGFTHYALEISPVLLRIARVAPTAAESVARWLPLADALEAGLPAPVRRILANLFEQERHAKSR